MIDLAQVLDTMEELSRASGELIMPYYRKPLTAEYKQDDSPVTVADKEAEGLMRRALERRFPDHGIMGEEYGHRLPDSPQQWILDPIDGTKSFLSGMPLFGTLIGFMNEGRPVAGCLHFPALGHLLIGTEKVSLLNGAPVHVRPCRELSEATLLTTDVFAISQHQPVEGFRQLGGQVRLNRTWGDCYGYFLLATGYADIMVDPQMNPWDLLPLIPVVRGAGGTITDYQGGDPVKGSSSVATGGPLHERVIQILNQ